MKENIMEEVELRAIEIKFYLMVHRLYRLMPERAVLLFFIDNLHMFSKHNNLIIKDVVMKTLSYSYITPNPIESVVALTKIGMSVRKVCKLLGMNNVKYYRILNLYKADPYPITFKTTPKVIEEMQKLLDAIKNIYEIGEDLL